MNYYLTRDFNETSRILILIKKTFKIYNSLKFQRVECTLIEIVAVHFFLDFNLL